jgi:thiamine biosynthesis lipoprotein
VTRRLQAIDDRFSPWRPDSWVSRLISGVAVPADCPSEVQRVVEIAVDLMEVTDGYFSPFWRRLPHGDPGPDPTGLVKGWAAQQASDVLISHGLPDHVVNAAGDVIVSGRSTPGDPECTWRIGISDPHRPRTLAGVLDLDQTASRWAVATSGTAELGAHVSDPHNGSFPCTVASATVVARLDSTDEGAAVADACATALVAAGEEAPALADRLATHGVDVLLIDSDGTVRDPHALIVPA